MRAGCREVVGTLAAGTDPTLLDAYCGELLWIVRVLVAKQAHLTLMRIASVSLDIVAQHAARLYSAQQQQQPKRNTALLSLPQSGPSCSWTIPPHGSRKKKGAHKVCIGPLCCTLIASRTAPHVVEPSVRRLGPLVRAVQVRHVYDAISRL